MLVIYSRQGLVENAANVTLIRSFLSVSSNYSEQDKAREEDIENDDFISWDSKQCVRMQHFVISCWKTNRSIWFPAAEIPTFLSHLLFFFSEFLFTNSENSVFSPSAFDCIG